MEIDPSLRDAFGIPTLRMHMTYGENERAMVQDMADSAAEMMEAAGAKNIRTTMKKSIFPDGLFMKWASRGWETTRRRPC